MTKRKVAIVTGAATGIGRACAQRLAQEDFNVVANFRSQDDQIATLMPSLKAGEHIAVRADISDPQAARQLIDQTAEQFGQIDLLVNSAGIFEVHDIAQISYEEWQQSWEKTIKINLTAAMNLSFCAAKHMIPRRSGKIINISSRGAFRGEPNAPAYGASKSGLNSGSQSLAQALAPHGIFVFAIAPGWVNTPLVSEHVHGERGLKNRQQSPLNRFAEPEEIAHIAAFLARDGTDYLTGSILDANGASYLRN